MSSRYQIAFILCQRYIWNTFKYIRVSVNKGCRIFWNQFPHALVIPEWFNISHESNLKQQRFSRASTVKYLVELCKIKVNDILSRSILSLNLLLSSITQRTQQNNYEVVSNIKTVLVMCNRNPCYFRCDFSEWYLFRMWCYKCVVKKRAFLINVVWFEVIFMFFWRMKHGIDLMTKQ